MTGEQQRREREREGSYPIVPYEDGDGSVNGVGGRESEVWFSRFVVRDGLRGDRKLWLSSFVVPSFIHFLSGFGVSAF